MRVLSGRVGEVHRDVGSCDQKAAYLPDIVRAMQNGLPSLPVPLAATSERRDRRGGMTIESRRPRRSCARRGKLTT